MKAIAVLLRAKPEGEAALLTALVNKLGDPSRKLASKVGASSTPPLVGSGALMPAAQPCNPLRTFYCWSGSLATIVALHFH